MKRLAITIGYLSVLWLLASCAHHNSCSGRDRVAMEQGGFSAEEIMQPLHAFGRRYWRFAP
jgi:hypothetical protein